MELKCECCGKPFNVKYESKKHRFCSKSCAQKTRWKNTPKKTKEFTCQCCGKKFDVNLFDNRIKEGKEIKYCSHKCSGLGHRTGKMIKCENCQKEFYSTRNRFCSHSCFLEYKVKNYKHKPYKENDYICQYINGYNKKGNAKQHRLIVEEALGRKLKPDEVVHHINGNKQDNRIENLQVMSRSEHSSLHRKQEIADGKKLFTPKEKGM